MDNRIGRIIEFNGKRYIVQKSESGTCFGCILYQNPYVKCTDVNKILGSPCRGIIYKDMKEFTKENLKSGMVIEYRNGEKRLVVLINNCLCLLSNDNYLEGLEDCFNNNLTCKEGKELDIMKVYTILNLRELSKLLNDNEYLDLIWQREEPKEYTMQEIANKLGIPVEQLRIKK